MEEKKRLISVIVPIYNIEPYLGECLDSVCSQTYKEIQIILVNDGSTDRSGEICLEYAGMDSRITLVEKKNGGLVSARKAGAALAKGDYVCFVDGDDWVDPDLLEKVLSRMPENDPVDIVSFGCVEEYSEYQVSRYNSIPEGVYRGDRLAALKDELLMGEYFFQWRVLPHLCDKIIRREILNACIEKVPGSISFGEDAACTFPCILRADSVMSLNIAPYHYRQRQGSIVKQAGELEADKFTGLYKTLYEAVGKKEALLNQLKYYMFFVLCLKAYSRIETELVLFPFSRVRNHHRVLVYGAGGFGKVIEPFVRRSEQLELAGWADGNAEYYQRQGLEVLSPDQIRTREFDMVVIAILDEGVGLKVKEELEGLGIDSEKIDYVKEACLRRQPLPLWLAEKGDK